MSIDAKYGNSDDQKFIANKIIIQKEKDLKFRTEEDQIIEFRTSSGLNYIIKQVESEDSLLIVDDVHDTGISIEKIISDLKFACKKNTPEIKVATPYFKPTKNKTNRKPDYYLYETDKWLVFPHELEGLSLQEIKDNKPELKLA